MTWLVEYVVGADSMPKDIEIIVTADPILDERVIATVTKEWKSPPEFIGRKRREHFHFVSMPAPIGILVTAEFSVDSEGRPKDIQIVSSPERSKEKAIAAAVSKWRFPVDLAGQRWKQQFYFTE